MTQDSGRIPDGFQADRAPARARGTRGGAGPRGPRPYPYQLPNACMHAIGLLRDRGMDNPEQWAHLDPEAIEETVRWYDAQNGRVGIGVLVTELRKGGRRDPSRRDLITEQRDYAQQIVDWLERDFPDLDRPGYGPHPAAVAEVIRLHWRHGKARVSSREHGPAIRAAVARWESEQEEGR